MTQLIADNFNRANGALGSPWSVLSGSFNISGNALDCGGSGTHLAVISGTNGQPDVQASFDRLTTVYTTRSYGLVVRSDASANNCYYVVYYLTGTGSTSRLDLHKKVSGTDYQLQVVYQCPTTVADHALMLRAVGDRIQVLIDGNLYLDHVDADVSAGDYAGIIAVGGVNTIDNFLVETAVATAETTIVPSQMQVSTSGNVTITSSLGNWTPGTPGSPTITCDLGTINSQEVTDASTIVLDYTAPATAGTEVFHDGTNGLTWELVIIDTTAGDVQEVLRRLGTWVDPTNIQDFLLPITQSLQPGIFSSDPQTFLDHIAGMNFSLSIDGLGSLAYQYYKEDVAQGDSLWSAIVAILAMLGANRGLGMDTNQEVHTISTLAHYSLLDVMNTIQGTSSIDNTELWDYLHDLRTVNGYDLGSILLAIEGVRGVDNRNLTQIYNLLLQGLEVDLTPVLDILNHLTNSDTQTLQTILTAIAGVRGAGNYDLAALIAQWGAYRTNENWTMQDIQNWITAIRGSGTPTLENITNNITNVSNYLTLHLPTIETKLDTLLDKANQIIASIAAIVAAIPDMSSGVPLWPGLDNVVLGTPVLLTGNIEILGAMDGLLVEWDQSNRRFQSWQAGSINAWYRCGQMSFLTDRGDAEGVQYLTFDKQVYTPIRSIQGGGCVVHCTAGVVGTATPWTRIA